VMVYAILFTICTLTVTAPGELFMGNCRVVTHLFQIPSASVRTPGTDQLCKARMDAIALTSNDLMRRAMVTTKQYPFDVEFVQQGTCAPLSDA
jgi:hypothetical protein